MKISRTATPLAAIDVTVTAEWYQRYEGRTDISRLLQDKFPEGLINTLTGSSLEKKWWRRGDKIGRSGYWIAHSDLQGLGMIEHEIEVKIPMAWSAPQQIDLAAPPLKGSGGLS